MTQFGPVGDLEPWTITLGELDERMGVEIVEQSWERVITRMPVAGNRQSYGLLHGGALLALGEATGSWAANIHASTLGLTCVGIDASGSHHRSVRDGFVIATATPIRLGRTVDVHQVVVRAEDSGERLSTFRITDLLREPR